MELYRLTQKKFSADPFSPIGAKLYGGRWNSKGTEALYFSASESLCSLEVLAHMNHDPGIIDLYDLYRITIPDELIAQLDEEDLPTSWRAIPVHESTQLIGNEFLASGDAGFAALQIPSVISPRDCNYLVNPHHPAVKQSLLSTEKLDFLFDPRIFRFSTSEAASA